MTDPYGALRFRENRFFLLGAFALFMGTQIQTVAVGWQVYTLTGPEFLTKLPSSGRSDCVWANVYAIL